MKVLQAQGETGERASTVRVRMTRGDGDAAEFQPLIPAREVTVELDGVDPGSVDRLVVEGEATLVQGSHALPIFAAADLPVVVAEGTRARFRVEARHRREASATVIESVTLELGPSLGIREILPVLAKLPTLFEDEQLAPILATLRRAASLTVAGRGVDALRIWLTDVTLAGLRRLPIGLAPGAELGREQLAELLARVSERMREGASDFASVELARVTAKPVRRGGTWMLEPRFSGRFVVMGEVPIPFVNVALPHAVIPAPHADLARLSDQGPLATGRLRTEGLRAEALADGIAALLGAVVGSFELEGRLPRLELDALLPDHGLLDLKVGTAERTRTRASFEARVGRDEAVITLSELEVAAGDGSVKAEGTVRLRTTAEDADGDGARDRGLGAGLVEIAREKRWDDPQLAAEVSLTLREGSRLPTIDLSAGVRHRELVGGIDAHATLEEATVHGAVRLSLERGALRTEADARFEGAAIVHPGSGIDDNLVRLVAQRARAKVAGSVRLGTGRAAELTLTGEAKAELETLLRMAAFPELAIDDGEWRAQVPAEATFTLQSRVQERDGALYELDFSGSKVRATLGEIRAELGARLLTVPDGAVLDLAAREAVIATSGLGRALFDVAWDLQGRSPLLRNGAESIEVLVPALVKRGVTIALSPAGGLAMTGDKGDLFDGALFNALLNPGADPKRLLQLLEDDKTMDRILGPLRVLSPRLHDFTQRLRALARRLDGALEAEGIRAPGDALPGRTLARILSRVLSEGTELEERAYALVKSVTDGNGLDVRATKRLINDALEDHDWQFELDRGVRLLAKLLAPAAELPPWDTLELPPLEDLPAQRARLASLPSARAMYRAIAGGAPLDPATSEAIARQAPYLAPEQLDHLLSAGSAAFAPRDWKRLRRVRDLTRRVQLIEDSYGGVSFTPQAHAISFFLGEALSASEADAAPWSDGLALGGSLFGPEDVATLLQAGLASLVQGRTVQRNLRLLLGHVLSRPREYVREVLVELGRGNARVLAGALNALLNMEQYHLKEPLDLPAELGARLGMELPRLSDFLAGGRRANESYFEALTQAAERILAEAEPYLALRCHLRIDRDAEPAVVTAVKPEAGRATREQKAQRAIAEADATGARWKREAGDPKGRARALDAYEAAFAACRAVIEEDPRAFQRPWLKDFWARNHEALVVWSVVRGVQEDRDADRRWLRIRTAAEIPTDEQALLEAVVSALFHHADDRARLLGDPLVRLLIDPPPGRYDFTIVAAMGVITEGARGHELDTAFARLEQKRGVRAVRADTATMRSLEYNAACIEAAVRTAVPEGGPWGYVGYSQGCANGLAAESRLLGGTPAQQALAERLVARNLLFSAFNGSAHGTCSDAKYLQAMSDGERILKHWQATLSRRAIEMGLSALRLSLDSREAVVALLGSFSLSHDGVIFVQREGRFRDDVPTSLVRGVVEPETLPEALEWLANVLTKQTGTPEHDTQVVATEAVGHPLRVRNEAAAILERCDMGCMVQRTHHWSPLVKETEFVTTERDRALAIYDVPKDRHVEPWIEVNARFGRIRRATTG
jgi:hypothetical protein